MPDRATPEAPTPREDAPARRRPRTARALSATIRPLLATAVASAGIGGAALAMPAQTTTFTFGAAFTPNALGAATNLSTTMTFASGAGDPQPISELVAFAPAGLELDVQGVATCEHMTLEVDGPSGCPAQSRIGFGGGVGVFDLAGGPVKEPYTLDFFLAPQEHGHLAILIYADAVNPVAVQFVLTAREVHGPRPYGFGLAVEVPPVSTVPGAANASVESSFASLGGADIAYYQTIHGRRTLVHIKGLVAPATCPAGGFPFEVIVTFEDGSTSTASYSSPCPSGRP
jgi:hypothetical protein